MYEQPELPPHDFDVKDFYVSDDIPHGFDTLSDEYILTHNRVQGVPHLMGHTSIHHLQEILLSHKLLVLDLVGDINDLDNAVRCLVIVEVVDLDLIELAFVHVEVIHHAGNTGALHDHQVFQLAFLVLIHLHHIFDAELLELSTVFDALFRFLLLEVRLEDLVREKFLLELELFIAAIFFYLKLLDFLLQSLNLFDAARDITA